jgi:hypothetical protein
MDSPSKQAIIDGAIPPSSDLSAIVVSLPDNTTCDCSRLCMPGVGVVEVRLDAHRFQARKYLDAGLSDWRKRAIAGRS